MRGYSRSEEHVLVAGGLLQHKLADSGERVGERLRLRLLLELGADRGLLARADRLERAGGGGAGDAVGQEVVAQVADGDGQELPLLADLLEVARQDDLFVAVVGVGFLGSGLFVVCVSVLSIGRKRARLPRSHFSGRRRFPPSSKSSTPADFAIDGRFATPPLPSTLPSSPSLPFPCTRTRAPWPS